MITKPFYMLWNAFHPDTGQELTPVENVIAACRRSGIGGITIKVAGGTYLHNVRRGSANQKPLKEYIAALRSAGLEVWGWHYVYPEQPGPQGDLAESLRIELDLAGYTFDVELEWKKKGLGKAAETLLGKMHKNKDIGFCSYRYPLWHPQIPYGSWLHHEAVTFNCPQVYWEQAHNPVEQLRRSMDEYALYTNKRFVPVGITYSSGSWEPSQADLKAFVGECKRLKFNYGFYSIDWIVKKNRADWLDAIGEANGVGDTPPVTPEPEPVDDDTTWTEFELLNSMSIRSGPGTSNKVIGQAKAGEIVRAKSVMGTDAWIETDKGWVCVKLGGRKFAQVVER